MNTLSAVLVAIFAFWVGFLLGWLVAWERFDSSTRRPR